MDTWKVSTHAQTHSQGSQTWREAIDRLYLPEVVDLPDSAGGFHGDVCSMVSPQGLEFARLTASPQTISGRSRQQPFSLWVSVLMEGRFELQDGARTCVLEPGTIIYGPTGLHATLTLRSDFRMLYVKIPHRVMHPALLNPQALTVGALPRDEAVNRIFADTLIAVANHMDDLDHEHLRPVETAVIEFAVASLAKQTDVRTFGNPSRLLRFKHICQSVENQLSDPTLSVLKIAEQQHASPRYVQKLFEAAGSSFGTYLRLRRLERCRADLQSPMHLHLSISDICLNWGFSDPAHFSRSFRSEYGTTPREFRQTQAALRPLPH